MVQAFDVQGPASRRLRIFAFDPSLALRIDTAGINEITIGIPWERDPETGRSLLTAGPVGEYLEIVDFDPASNAFYEPVDLNDPAMLAQDGVAPSESNPKFHQQMVYAVAMATIGHFERALGRVALWGSHKFGRRTQQFVRRLRIYPHALRDRNAFYSPEKKAILFGYFTVKDKDAYNTPGTLVFTCLSHDIIAHEVTHALLDGVHPRFNEPTNPDVYAFHEAFADIVAVFQHFSYPGVLRDQIARSRGDLTGETLLAQLAQQFGQASGRGAALRDFLGGMNKQTRKWERREPDARALEKITEPHSRGAILVAAVFGAFLLHYKSRTVDLYRIATEGTGVLRAGDIHPDLARRLAEEASRSAQYLLQMCIRALDYCPPVDITFGDYLRAIVTADIDLNPDDDYQYRLAIIESFRQWGIYPRRIKSMAIESLQWESGLDVLMETNVATEDTPVQPWYQSRLRYDTRQDFNQLFEKEQPAGATDQDDEDAPSHRSGASFKFEPWNLESDRFTVWQKMEDNRWALWRWLVDGEGRAYAKSFGLVLEDADAPKTVYRNEKNNPSVEIHSVRTALRRSARGTILTDLVVEITQRRRGYFDPEDQRKADAGELGFSRGEDGDFKFRAGCTILIDPLTRQPRRIIRTAGTVADNDELERVRRFLTDASVAASNAFDATRPVGLRNRSHRRRREPFAMLHRHAED